MTAFAAVLQLVSLLRFYHNVRQTFPVGSLLSAVRFNVRAIGKIGGGKETSEGPKKRAAVMSWMEGRVHVNHT